MGVPPSQLLAGWVFDLMIVWWDPSPLPQEYWFRGLHMSEFWPAQRLPLIPLGHDGEFQLHHSPKHCWIVYIWWELPKLNGFLSPLILLLSLTAVIKLWRKDCNLHGFDLGRGWIFKLNNAFDTIILSSSIKFFFSFIFIRIIISQFLHIHFVLLTLFVNPILLYIRWMNFSNLWLKRKEN